MKMEPRFLWSNKQLFYSQAIGDLTLLSTSELENFIVTK